MTSNCVMGFIPTGQGVVFVAGAPQSQTVSGTYYGPVPGYQLTMTDGSAVTVDVDGFAVVFYDSAGTELGSDKENVTEQFITAGQSLAWTEYSPTDTAGGSYDFGDATIPAGAPTCQLVTWYHP